MNRQIDHNGKNRNGLMDRSIRIPVVEKID